MKLKIFAVGDGDKHFSKPIEEYKKRLNREIEIVDIKPEKHGEIPKIKKKETEKVKEKLRKNQDNKVLLSLDGKDFSTEEFTSILEKHPSSSFIIGGAYGLEEEALSEETDMKIRLSPFTLPHGLSKLLILEQIFRAKSIMEGKSYHY